MKSLLFALGLALCCFAQTTPDQRFEDIDRNLLPRKGIVTAIVSNCEKMKQMAASMPAFYVYFKEVSQNELQMTMNMATRDGCKTMSPKITKENGVFTTRCGHGGEKTLEYVRFNEDGSMFTSITLSHQGGQCSIATLTVTDLANTQGSLDGFRAFARRQGLGDEEVKVLSTESRSLEAAVETQGPSGWKKDIVGAMKLWEPPLPPDVPMFCQLQKDVPTFLIGDQTGGLETAGRSGWSCFGLGSNCKF